ncbi:MAG: 16S rRNA (uracil(1498)-N(3))-methyltransferase [Puniceicoccales bacterium]|jgi:16S rRNA (uracil1498-N3)-methyltransferase|nr:16S rRNA (uracil(1498)-N(3))-methyltransferase [Puniceicoccales bacterium]
MLRVFHCGILERQSIIRLDPKEAHHLFRVLRAGDGEKVAILDGCGRYAEGHIVDRKTQEIAIDDLHFARGSRIALYPALLKSGAMDFLIREATAIGVGAIIPLATEHAAVKMDVKMAAKKQLHWNNIAREACKQSGNPVLPAIELPQKIEQIDFARPTFLAALRQPTTDLFRHESAVKSGAINLIIGPEGDFSEREYRLFSEKNAHFIRLGPHILRAETAALYLLSAVDYLRARTDDANT